MYATDKSYRGLVPERQTGERETVYVAAPWGQFFHWNVYMNSSFTEHSHYHTSARTHTQTLTKWDNQKPNRISLKQISNEGWVEDGLDETKKNWRDLKEERSSNEKSYWNREKFLSNNTRQWGNLISPSVQSEKANSLHILLHYLSTYHYRCNQELSQSNQTRQKQKIHWDRGRHVFNMRRKMPTQTSSTKPTAFVSKDTSKDKSPWWASSQCAWVWSPLRESTRAGAQTHLEKIISHFTSPAVMEVFQVQMRAR